MNALLRNESLKIRSLRSPWVVIGLVAALSTVFGVALAGVHEKGVRPPSLAEIARGPAQLAWLGVIVLAVLASAGEFQHRTIRTTLLAAPRRVPVLMAKSVVAATTGAMLVAGGAVLALGSALVTAQVSGTSLSSGTAANWAAVAGSVGVGALWGVLATGLGMLTRSTAASISVVLLWRFVGEGILPVVLRNQGIVRWTPSGAANALVGLGGSNVLPVAAAALVLAGYVAAVCGAAALLFLRSDPA